jgi:hypothetical protein
MSPVPAVLSRSAAKRARDLNGKIEFAKAPMQALWFQATPTEETAQEGDYYNYQFVRSGFATEDEFNSLQGPGRPVQGLSRRGRRRVKSPNLKGPPRALPSNGAYLTENSDWSLIPAACGLPGGARDGWGGRQLHTIAVRRPSAHGRRPTAGAAWSEGRHTC